MLIRQQQQQQQGELAAAGNAVPVYDLQSTQASFVFRPPLALLVRQLPAFCLCLVTRLV